MKRFKGTIIFIISFFIILALDFALYKNIDRFLPTHEKELYVFENNSNSESKEFLSEMYELFELQNNCRPINDLNIIRKNEILYNLIKNSIYKGYNDDDFDKAVEKDLYVGELQNTIYGDLNVVCVISYKKTHYLVIYSEDMKNIFYLDVNQKEYTNSSSEFVEYYSKNTVYYIKENNAEDLTDEKSKTELINQCKSSFEELIKDYEFDPDTIIYKNSYYILKDNEKNITIYYNDTDNIIFGLYIGFDK